MENFGRHDQLPRILIEHLADRVLNLSLGDDVTGTDEHVFLGRFQEHPGIRKKRDTAAWLGS